MTKKIENWEKEFDEEFDMYNPIHDDGTKVPVWNKADFENIKSFIRQEKAKDRQKFIEIVEDAYKGLPFIQRQIKEALKDEKFKRKEKGTSTDIKKFQTSTDVKRFQTS